MRAAHQAIHTNTQTQVDNISLEKFHDICLCRKAEILHLISQCSDDENFFDI